MFSFKAMITYRQSRELHVPTPCVDLFIWLKTLDFLFRIVMMNEW